MKTYLLFFALFFCGVVATAQSTYKKDSVWVLFDATSTQAQRLKQYSNSVSYVYGRIGDSANYASIMRSIAAGKHIIGFEISSPTTIFINDFFRHQVYVTPGDTVMVTVDTFYRNEAKSATGFLLPWSVRFSYGGKNAAYHSFFDSLSYQYGACHTSAISPKQMGFQLQSYLDSIKALHALRMTYLSAYSKRHKLNQHFIELAKAEISGSYYNMLISSLRFYQNGITRSSLPPEYKTALDEIKCFGSAHFFTTYNASRVALQYLRYWATSFLPMEPFGSNQLEELCKYIASNTAGEERDYLMSMAILENVANKSLPTAATVTLYEKACKSKTYCNAVMGKVIALQHLKTDYSLVLNQPVVLQDQQPAIFRQLLADSITLVDCWASWCKPCIEQFPAMDMMQKKYAGKLRFITLSFDTSPAAWKKGILTHGLEANNAFSLSQAFESVFAIHFGISSIPRYLLFAADGKILEANFPFPSNTNAFEVQINKYILKGK